MDVFRLGERLIASHATAAINSLRKLDHDMPPSRSDRPRLFTALHAIADETGPALTPRAQYAAGHSSLHLSPDLPTLCGVDSDHPLARHEIGRGGLPICHIGDMQDAFDGVPLDQIDLALEAGGASPWLLALYVALAEDRGVDPAKLRGIGLGDIFTESLVGQTGICALEPALQIQADMMAWAERRLPKWSSTSLSAVSLISEDMTETVERALTSAIALLDALRDRVKPEIFEGRLERIGFSASLESDPRQTTETIQMLSQQWRKLCQDRYEHPIQKRRALPIDLKVNSISCDKQLGDADLADLLPLPVRHLIPEGTYPRSVRLSPAAGNSGIEMGYGSHSGSDVKATKRKNGGDAAVRENRSSAVESEAAKSLANRLAASGNPVEALLAMRSRLFSKTRFHQNDRCSSVAVREDHLARLAAWREKRNGNAAQKSLLALREAAKRGIPLMGPSVACAKAGVTTGEWATVMRNVFGGVDAGMRPGPVATTVPERLSRTVAEVSARLGRAPAMLIGRPGFTAACGALERLAVTAESSGVDLHDIGARLTPHDILSAALKERTHLIALTLRSASQLPLLSDIHETLKAGNLGHIPVFVVGSSGIADRADLEKLGIARSYDVENLDPDVVLRDMLALIDRQKTTA